MTQATALDTCRVRWWSGYVKGRFQAYADTTPPELTGESRTIRWRPPEPTAEAKGGSRRTEHAASPEWLDGRRARGR